MVMHSVTFCTNLLTIIQCFTFVNMFGETTQSVLVIKLHCRQLHAYYKLFN